MLGGEMNERRWSRRGCEVLLGKQDLPKSAIALVQVEIPGALVVVRPFRLRCPRLKYCFLWMMP